MNKRLLYAASTASHLKNFHLEIISGLRSRGYTVLTMARGGGVDYDLPFEKRIFSLKNLMLVKRVRQILKKERFDALILNTTLASVVLRAALPKRLKKTTKVINFVHGYLFSGKIRTLRSFLFWLPECLLRKKTDAVITMNGEDEKNAKRWRLAKRIIKSDGVGAVIREEGGQKARGDGFVITFVGELSRRKNQAFLIKCISRLREFIPNATLCLVGEGDEKPRLLRLDKRLCAAGTVSFLGQREDAQRFIAECDLYASAARCEGLPINIIEALSLGKTVLASDIKGHADLISSGKNGYLFKLGDERDFIRRAIEIQRGGVIEPSEAKKSVRRYNRTACAEKILKILSEVL